LHFDATYRPSSDEARIGGDWYDALRLADGRIVISIGDVSGSGLGAAVSMAAMRQVIRGVAYVHPDPVMILDAAGRTLCEEFPNDQVSAFVGVIDPISLVFTYASAGHPSPLLRLPDGTVEELSFEGTLLGVRAPGERPSRRRQLPENALLVLYTDGLTQADPIDGERRLAQALQDPRTAQAESVAQALEHATLKDKLRDDVAVLAVGIERSPYRVERGSPARGVSRWEFDACDPRAAQLARTAFTDDLREVTSVIEDLFTAELVFSELIGNVVRYAAGPVEVIVDWMGSAPVLHVRDRGPGFTHIPKLPRDIMAENGRGLYIISSLTEEFNVERAPECGSHARAVLSLSCRRLTRPINPLPVFALDKL
jgi:anti-sigma regulatory factor (Ser/Thr protein kinase)